MENFIAVILDDGSLAFIDYLLVYEFYCQRDLINEYGVWNAFNIVLGHRLPEGRRAVRYSWLPVSDEAWKKLDALRSLNKNLV